jgi:hypothetical protein
LKRTEHKGDFKEWRTFFFPVPVPDFVTKTSLALTSFQRNTAA